MSVDQNSECYPMLELSRYDASPIVLTVEEEQIDFFVLPRKDEIVLNEVTLLRSGTVKENHFRIG
jgi:hypothetical protein